MENLSRDEMLELLLRAQGEDFGLIFWALRSPNNQPAQPAGLGPSRPPAVGAARPPPGAGGRSPPAAAVPDWCVCTHCRAMGTDVENICCGQQPQWCTSRLPQMGLYITEGGVLHLAVGIWHDVRAQPRPQNHNDRNRAFRHASYRNWVMWQNGVLGAGVRVVIYSCCVWVIRDKYPDSNGQYTGFRPSRV